MTATPKLGEITRETALLGRRDAMHCAAVLVTCDRLLSGGESVRFTDTTCRKVEFAADANRQAIVDPFLPAQTVPGELFWVLLRPELVSGMHHQFDIGEVAEDDEDEEIDVEDDYEPRGVRHYGASDGCSGSWCNDH